jgi:Protein of unknown function (DUF4197)
MRSDPSVLSALQRRQLMLALASGAGLSLLARDAEAGLLSETDAASGVRGLLERGAISAIGLLGKNDGFLGNPLVRIPMPAYLQNAAKLLKAIGQQKRIDALVLAMNRAAEAAMPEAKSLLVGAVKAMSVEDALQVVRGGDNSVTEFFSGKTREPLGTTFLPIVTKATEKVSLADKYNSIAGKAASLGFVKPEDANIQQYVTGKALDGLFLMIGEEERKIRKDPVATGSAILKKVFGALK